MSLNFSTVWW